MTLPRLVRLAACGALVVLCCWALLAAGDDATADEAAGGRAVLLTIDGAIGPATADYLSRGLAGAGALRPHLIILTIDTPGGLLESTRAIIRDILASPVPVVAFVAPSGAHAASAGTFLVYAAHVAAMAPGTSLGAATPVAIGAPGLPAPPGEKEPGKDGDNGAAKRKPQGDDKAMNDAVATIRSLAQLRGRDVAFAEKAVREAATLTAADALKQGVIEIIATDVADLLRQLDGRSIVVDGRTLSLATSGMTIETVAPDWRARFLAVITNPTVAAVLMMIGIYGVLFEFYSPGLVGPGVIGGICLLLALYAFHVLPVDYTGLSLLLLGIALMVAEAFLPSFGIIGLGGLAAFVLGAVLLLDTEVPGYGVSWTLLASIGFILGGSFAIIVSMVARSRRRAPETGTEQLVRMTGRVLEWGDATHGTVLVHGERWAARAAAPLPSGATVRVRRVDGLVLVVEPQTDTKEP